MLFNSYPFLVLLAIAFTAYYLPLFRNSQVLVLIAASFVFYAWEMPVLLLLLVASIAFNSLVSRLASRQALARLPTLIALGVAVNLGVLMFFKYGRLIGPLLPGNLSLIKVLAAAPLPIGISFYTFESISLLVDIFRHRTKRQPEFLPETLRDHTASTALFVSFFPHLISGPILKAEDFYPQIGRKRLADVPWDSVFRFCVTGFFLKLVVADNLKDFTSDLNYPQFVVESRLKLLVLVFGYSIQIFSDFAGYSLIAQGLGAMFGYTLPTNFNFPYIANSLGDFWRRWHISLSSWLRSYLYFPLGGNRHGEWRTYFNLFAVMVLGGLWHGAAWSFAVWGLYHGIGLAAERFAADRFFKGVQLPDWVARALVFSFVTAGWLLFKLSNFHDVGQFLSCLVHPKNLDSSDAKYTILGVGLLSAPVVAYHFAAALRPVGGVFRKWESISYGSMLASIVVAQGLPGSFIYFQF